MPVRLEYPSVFVSHVNIQEQEILQIWKKPVKIVVDFERKKIFVFNKYTDDFEADFSIRSPQLWFYKDGVYRIPTVEHKDRRLFIKMSPTEATVLEAGLEDHISRTRCFVKAIDH